MTSAYEATERGIQKAAKLFDISEQQVADMILDFFGSMEWVFYLGGKPEKTSSPTP